MFEKSGKKRRTDRFWPWLYKTALNKMRIGHAKPQYRSPVSATATEDAQVPGEQGAADTISRELHEIIFSAMRRLKPRHRAVLIMRCFRQMDYSHIAESMQCSEFAAEMLFFRAKKDLKRQLSHYGYGRGMLLTALILFGKITAPSEAAAKTVSVSAATTKVGLAAGLAATATSKTTILSLATAGVITLGTVAVTSGPDPAGVPPAGKSPGSSQLNKPAAAKGVEEYWHYYPRGVNGPVMMRLRKSDSQGKNSYCQWLQNERANYYFDKGKNTIYIKNHRTWHNDLAVWRLPTDDRGASDFISRVQGTEGQMQYVPGDGAGLLVILEQDKGKNHSRITHHYNVLDEMYFLYDWPSRAKITDARDAMHKRGWTFFRITGEIDKEQVSGTGRLPFVYATSKWNYPWLKMSVGGRLKLVDTGAEARLYDRDGNLTAKYEGGTFFKGLGRPWMGLHAIDTVRRDAARRQIWFESAQKGREGTAEVLLSAGQTELIYTIDMDKDVIETIAFSTADGRGGILRFTYLEDIDQSAGKFVSPRQQSPSQRKTDRLGMLWLVKLMDSRW